MKYIDLSYEITDGMPIYPGDEEVELEFKKIYDNDGYSYSVLRTGMHVGTHIDCPMHLTNNRKYISQYELDNFIGCGVLLDVVGEKVITKKKGYGEKIRNKDIVILRTGYEKYYGTEKYYNSHPVLSEELVKLFIENGVKIVGFDMPSPDMEPFPIHKLLLNNEIFIIENLCNLKELREDKDFKVIALPLKIRGEGSLVRAIAIS